MVRQWRSFLAVALLVSLLGTGGPASAVTNAALGGFGGLNNGTLQGGDGTGTAAVTIEVAALALVKQARDATGAVLPDGAPVAAGQTIFFVLFVDNPTLYPAEDLQITDLLDQSQFTYIPGTLAGTTVATGASDAALWGAAWAPLSDAVGSPDDVASMLDTGVPDGPDRFTLGAVPVQANLMDRVPARMIRAVRFQVRVN